MLPLNYAILKFFTRVPEACADDVMAELKDQYGHFQAFKKSCIMTALMTAEVNNLLEESRYDLDGENNLRVYFRAHEEGAATINKYIKG